MPHHYTLPALISAAGLALIAAIIPAANAGCGDYKGLIQICFKGSCEVQKMVRHCSSVMAGSHWISDQGYQFGYSREIGGRWSQLNVVYEPYEKVLYSGDPDQSPYTFDICGEDRNVGGPCSEKSWANGLK